MTARDPIGKLATMLDKGHPLDPLSDLIEACAARGERVVGAAIGQGVDAALQTRHGRPAVVRRSFRYGGVTIDVRKSWVASGPLGMQVEVRARVGGRFVKYRHLATPDELRALADKLDWVDG